MRGVWDFTSLPDLASASERERARASSSSSCSCSLSSSSLRLFSAALEAASPLAMDDGLPESGSSFPERPSLFETRKFF